MSETEKTPAEFLAEYEGKSDDELRAMVEVHHKNKSKAELDEVIAVFKAVVVNIKESEKLQKKYMRLRKSGRIGKMPFLEPYDIN